METSINGTVGGHVIISRGLVTRGFDRRRLHDNQPEGAALGTAKPKNKHKPQSDKPQRGTKRELACDRSTAPGGNLERRCRRLLGNNLHLDRQLGSALSTVTQ
jgi:hypothetical protein